MLQKPRKKTRKMTINRESCKNINEYCDFINVCSITAKFPQLNRDMLQGNITFLLPDTEKAAR